MQAWLVLSVVTFVLWGLWGFLAKVASESIDARSAAVMQGLGAFAVTVALLASMRLRLEFHAGGTTAAVLGGMALMVGIVTFTAALAAGGRASVVVPLSALYPVVAIGLGVLLLSESVSLTQGFGIGLALVAIVLMSR